MKFARIIRFVTEYLSHILGELLTANYVEVKVLYRLASVLADIGDNSVSAGKSLCLCNLRDNGEYVSNDIRVFFTYCINRSNMIFGNDEYVRGRLGIYISESVALIVLVYL